MGTILTLFRAFETVGLDSADQLPSLILVERHPLGPRKSPDARDGVTGGSRSTARHPAVPSAA
jgi:hypothetical protein